MNELILIVEDEKDMAELIRYNLEKHDYRTIIAEDGERAITLAQSAEPDLVLLDIMLSKLNGWEVCRTLRESTKRKTVPIVMLTALSSEDDRVKGLALGADDYLTKPFSIRELLLKVERILEKQRSVKKLIQKYQEQDASFRYLVHELKNAVSVIGGFSSLALAKGDANRCLGHITSAAFHMESILNDASLLAKLEHGTGSLYRQSIVVDDLVKDAVETFGEAARSRGMEISVVNATAARVWGNATAIRQILFNLLSNAVKYGRNGGRIWIYFDEGEGWLDISVKDEGPGIPKDELTNIFNKFFRGRGSENIKGTGLGLYVVKLLAGAMGGTVRVASDFGRGSTFTVTLEKVKASQSTSPAAA
jgi:signal transduction histidine kinase